jgi:hypothetical protein
LQTDVDCSLRRGAWYRVTAVGALEATVEVGRNKPQSVPSFLLQIVTAPPRRWTVVPRPAGAVRMPREWKQYGVCPSCHERAALPARTKVRTLNCDRCRGAFEIDWGEGYLAT